MWIAFIPVILWSFNALCSARAARVFGAAAANRWRLVLAAGALGIWTTLGPGWPGHRGATLWLLLSGVAGLGAGDLSMMVAYRNIGPRITALMLACLAVPVTAIIEWSWLGTRLTALQIALCGGILGGVALAVAPGARIPAADRPALIRGLLHGLIAAAGQGLGVALSRAAYRAAEADGIAPHGVSAAAVRMLGGLACTLLLELARRGARRRRRVVENRDGVGIARYGMLWRDWRWLIAAALLGPILGVSAYQWALIRTPGALVQSIAALVPVAVIPLAWRWEGDSPGVHGIAGGAAACGCAVALALLG